MGRHHSVVQLDPEAGGGRRNDVAVLPLKRLFQQRRMESVHLADGFQDQEIGNAGGKLDVRRRRHRTAIEMRCHLHISGFRHGGDLLALENAAGAAKVGLQNGCRAEIQHPRKFELAAQPLACRHRNRCAGRYLCHFLGHVGRARLLEP